jgi:predicted small metal-binding protein
MPKLSCRDYGFECQFEVEGDAEQILEQFGKHTNKEHGIEYSKETIMQIILRKA